MAFICNICDTSVARKQPWVSCGGSCKKQFHISCVHSSSLDLKDALNKIPGLLWKCPDCTDCCITVNEEQLHILIQETISNALSSFVTEFQKLKDDLVNTTYCSGFKATLSKESVPLKYADILKNKSVPGIIIEPKSEQDNKQTRNDILENIDPVETDLKIAKIKNVKNGGILIGCANKDENDKLKKMALEKLSGNYVIKEVNGIHPRIRVVGFTENYPEKQLLSYIIKMNSTLINNQSECKVIKIYPTKNNKNVYQAVLQLDKASYERAITAGNLFVGYDSCTVYDAIEIYRCFNCNDYNHSSKFCKKVISCPRCAGNHGVKDCKAKTLKCSNCLSLRDLGKSNISVNHAVWDTNECTSYINAREKLRSDLMNLQ